MAYYLDDFLKEIAPRNATPKEAKTLSEIKQYLSQTPWNPTQINNLRNIVQAYPRLINFVRQYKSKVPDDQNIIKQMINMPTDELACMHDLAYLAEKRGREDIKRYAGITMPKQNKKAEKAK